MHFDDCVIYLLKKDVSRYLTDVNGLDLHLNPYLSFVPVGALEFQETLKWTLSHLQALSRLSKEEEIIKDLFLCVNVFSELINMSKIIFSISLVKIFSRKKNYALIFSTSLVYALQKKLFKRFKNFKRFLKSNSACLFFETLFKKYFNIILRLVTMIDHQ